MEAQSFKSKSMTVMTHLGHYDDPQQSNTPDIVVPDVVSWTMSRKSLFDTLSRVATFSKRNNELSLNIVDNTMTLCAYNDDEECMEEAMSVVCDWRISLSLSFVRKDLQDILKRLKQAINKSNKIDSHMRLELNRSDLQLFFCEFDNGPAFVVQAYVNELCRRGYMTYREALVAYRNRFGQYPPMVHLSERSIYKLALDALERGTPVTMQDVGLPKGMVT